jgi:hypothetical protein
VVDKNSELWDLNLDTLMSTDCCRPSPEQSIRERASQSLTTYLQRLMPRQRSMFLPMCLALAGYLRSLGPLLFSYHTKVRSYIYHWDFTNRLACLLSSANHIIAIGKQGKILEQGNFTQLKLAGGYVYRLLSQSEESETSVTEEKTITQKQATAKQPAAVSVTPVTPDKKRQTGDLSVYKYFCQASGVHNVVIALSMAMASSFCVVYSCTPPHKSLKQVAMLTSDC